MGEKMTCRSGNRAPIVDFVPLNSKTCCYLLAFLVFFIPANCFSHPLGNFSINRYSRLEPNADTLVITYVVDFAEIPALQEKGLIDTDQDGQISDSESLQYLAVKDKELCQGFRLKINGKLVQLETHSKTISFPPGQAGLPTQRIELVMIAALPHFSLTAPLQIDYEDDNYSQRLGWKETIAKAGAKVDFVESNVPESDISNALRLYPKEMLYKPLDVHSASIKIVPGTGTASSASPEDRSKTLGASHRDVRFTRLIKTKDLSPRIYLIALLISIGLGAVHALSPGHGKSIVAAYLIGTRGTVKHAVFLGATVTLTHTLGVFTLGFITLFASRYILPEKLYPWLSLGSGVVVVGIGAAMLVKRIQGVRNQGLSAHHHPHEHSHHNHGDHSPNAHGHSHHDHEHHQHEITRNDHTLHHHHVEGMDSDHTHDHGHADHLPNVNPSDHLHKNRRRFTLFHHHHDHHHDHGHTHLPPMGDGASVTWRSLLALGITGGILPCPSALVVLLAAISMQRVGFGMILILMFSIGLAAVLTTIGLLFVKARQLLNRVPTAGPIMKILPAISALVIMILGIAITINALGQVF
jgi:ABC-type nickel/cobalt efflux system permease component RcnA